MEKARARGRGRRSPLYVWFKENHDELAAAFTKNAPSWTGLTAYLSDNGIMDGNGQKPSIRATREAWYRVKRDVAVARAKRTKETSDMCPEVALIQPIASITETISPTIKTDPDGYQPHVFKLASMRNATPADGPEPPQPVPAVAYPEPVLDQAAIDERLAQFLGKPVRFGFQPPKLDEGNE